MHRTEPPAALPGAGRLCLTALHADSRTLRAARAVAERFPGRFTIVTDPRAANIVLYLEDGYVGFANLPELIRRVSAARRAQHVLFSESDWPYPVLPGAFPSLTRPAHRADGWAYLIDLPLRLPAGTRPGPTAPRHLFSFLGRVATHPVRAEVLRLDRPGTPCLDLAAAPQRLAGFNPTRSYADLIRDSHFVLCPRGFGASSIRIFEAMCLGRAPVIIGDAWTPPPGVDWERCSVRVAEDQVAGIPARLAALRDHAPAMGALAAETFRALYAPDVFLDRLVTFLTERHAGESTAITHVLARAVTAAGIREFRTLAHQIIRRRS